VFQQVNVFIFALHPRAPAASISSNESCDYIS